MQCRGRAKGCGQEERVMPMGNESMPERAEKKGDGKKKKGKWKFRKHMLKCLSYIVPFFIGLIVDHCTEVAHFYDNYMREPILTYGEEGDFEYVANGFPLKSAVLSLYPQLWIMDGGRTIRRIGLPELYKEKENILYEEQTRRFLFTGGEWDEAEKMSHEVCGMLQNELGGEQTKAVRSIKVLFVKIRYSNLKAAAIKESYYIIRVSERSVEKIGDDSLEDYQILYEMDFDQENYDSHIVKIVQDCKAAILDQ